MDKSFLVAQKSQQLIHFKTASKRAIQRMTEAAGGLVGNKIAEKITKAASKNTCKNPNKLIAPTIIQL